MIINGFLPLVSVCVNSSRHCGEGGLIETTDAVCILFHISVWVWLSLWFIDERVLNKVTTVVEMFLVIVKHLLCQKDWSDQYRRPHESLKPLLFSLPLVNKPVVWCGKPVNTRKVMWLSVLLTVWNGVCGLCSALVQWRGFERDESVWRWNPELDFCFLSVYGLPQLEVELTLFWRSCH